MSLVHTRASCHWSITIAIIIITVFVTLCHSIAISGRAHVGSPKHESKAAARAVPVCISDNHQAGHHQAGGGMQAITAESHGASSAPNLKGGTAATLATRKATTSRASQPLESWRAPHATTTTTAAHLQHTYHTHTTHRGLRVARRVTCTCVYMIAAASHTASIACEPNVQCAPNSPQIASASHHLQYCRSHQQPSPTSAQITSTSHRPKVATSPRQGMPLSSDAPRSLP